ncbi:uncharacterized protein LOC133902417 [Phragmites australis]|uniref:uncharacterized protein LOC133902417 n=1 Tax=Phragmites australis TaxID=29695 RepID=UPI002D79A650|nr:uncharacterized protein LOC133902417 [Phragmites australis]
MAPLPSIPSQLPKSPIHTIAANSSPSQTSSVVYWDQTTPPVRSSPNSPLPVTHPWPPAVATRSCRCHPLAVCVAPKQLVPMATTPTQRYAAGALLALALRQAQIHQSAPLGGSPGDDEERASSASSSVGDAASDTEFWTHDSRGLLRPVFSIK